MSYYDTIAEDLTRAKAILEKGKPHGADPAIDYPTGTLGAARTIYGADIYAAYKLLESFVEEIERLQKQVKDLTQEKRYQYADLQSIREIADRATGIDRSKDDPRPPGAVGAVKVLVERFNALKEKT